MRQPLQKDDDHIQERSRCHPLNAYREVVNISSVGGTAETNPLLGGSMINVMATRVGDCAKQHILRILGARQGYDFGRARNRRVALVKLP
jgi:hypothetical protein